MENIKIVLIGPRDSGKTAYLTTLYAKEKTLITIGDTAKYFFDKLEKLKKGLLDETSEFISLNFRYKDSKYLTKFSIYDYPGILVEGNLKREEADNQSLVEAINQANGIIITLPYLENPQEHMTMLTNLWKDIKYVLELITNKENYKQEVPVIIALTKYDLFEKVADIRKTQKENLLKYFKDVQTYDKIYRSLENFSNVELTAFSIYQQEKNLINPIKIIIHNFYCNLELKIDKYSSNKFKLFIEIGKNFNALKLIKKGMFIRKFEEIQNDVKQYFLNLIEEEKSNHADSRQIKKAVEREKELFDTIRDKSIQEEIEGEIQKIRNSEKKKRLIKQSIFIFSILFLIFFYSYNHKKNAVSRIEFLISNSRDLLEIRKEFTDFKSDFSPINPFYALLGVQGDTLKLGNHLSNYTHIVKNQLNKSFQTILESSYDLDKKISKLTKIKMEYKKYFPHSKELEIMRETISSLQKKFKIKKDKAEKIAIEKEYLDILHIVDLNKLINKLDALYNRYYDSLGKTTQMQMVAKMLEVKKSQLTTYIKDNKISLKLDNFIQDFEENSSKYTVKDINKYLQNDIFQISSVEIAKKYHKKLQSLKEQKFITNHIQNFIKEFDEKLNQLTLKTLRMFEIFVESKKDIALKISDNQLSLLLEKLNSQLTNLENQMLDSNLSLEEKKYFIQELDKFNLPLLNFNYFRNDLNKEKINQLGSLTYLEFKFNTDKLFDCYKEKNIIINITEGFEFNGDYEIEHCFNNVVTISKIPTLEVNITDWNITK